MALHLHKLELNSDTRIALRPLVAFPSPPRSTRLTWGGGALSLGFSDGEWVLVEVDDLRLNGIEPAPFTRLRHGDVLAIRAGYVVVLDDAKRWPPRRLARTDLLGREVLHDTALEQGLPPPPWTGVLETIVGRGLTVTTEQGFPREARLDTDMPMVGIRPGYWLARMAQDPAWAFLERVEVIGEFTEYALECAGPLTAQGVVVVEAELPEEPAGEDLDWDGVLPGDSLTFFEQPAASSWLTEEV